MGIAPVVVLLSNTLIELFMKMEKEVKDRIVRNVLLSLLIYALPVLLMFLYFWITGQKPWMK
ncbi:hypothetical protein GCM10023231_13250 [Olivibacter ginsenosidimutans]|uniref:Cardiolipin synthase N-terminal domain-containing protein n=1 Tax=Olivibacter ginsenosidimutans TaxID=1176537 RepID=A0ABP9AW75_9SPHI